MSVLFTCPEAPVIRIPCPDKTDCEASGIKCNQNCDGTREESEAPECQFSNDNAFDVMELVGLPREYTGEIKPTNLADLQQRLLVAINHAAKRQHLIREPYITPRYVDGGNTDGQTLHRLQGLRKLVSYAQSHGYRVVWV